MTVSTWFCSPAKQLITHRGHSPKTTLLHRQAISGLQTDPGNDARSSGNCSRFPDSIAFPVSPFLCSHLSLWMWTLPPATRRTALFSRAEDFFAWIGETKTTDASDRIRWSHSSGRETCRSCKAKAEKVCCEGRLNLESLYTSSIKKGFFDSQFACHVATQKWTGWILLYYVFRGILDSWTSVKDFPVICE